MNRTVCWSALLGSLLFALTLAADEPLVVTLWPGPTPDDAGIPGEEKFFELNIKGQPHKVAGLPTKWLTNVTKPTLTIFRPDPAQDTGTSMLICPGGGYHNLGWDVEGEEVAAWLNAQGMTGILLKYRCPRRPGDVKGVPPIGPLKDAQRAISLVRSKAAEWKLDPHKIGMVGFSAGGHLVGATCTNFEARAYAPVDDIDKTSCRPDFGVLLYSGYFQVDNGLSPTIRTPANVPPMQIFHASDDAISQVEHSVRMYLEMKKIGAAVEMHIYETGGHGWGVRNVPHPCANWKDRCLDWLRTHQFVKSSSK